MTVARTLRLLRLIGWALAALALIAVVAWRVDVWSPSVDDDNEPRAEVGNGEAGLVQPGLDLYPAGQRVQAPPLEGTTLDGKPFALANLTGKIVVINVWGSWCNPCRAETPDLVRLANEYADRRVQFVGINTRDNTAAAQAFVRNFHVPYPNVKDDDGTLLLTFGGLIPISAVPSTVVIDRHGQVAARVIGPVTYRTLRGILDDELAAGGGGTR